VLSEEARRKILNPEPGTALARARDYGIDLTLILENIQLTPDELMDNVVRMQGLVRLTHEIREGSRRKR
jgi:hypothetical protein